MMKLYQRMTVVLVAGAGVLTLLMTDAPHTAYSADVCGGIGGRWVSINACGNPVERWAPPPAYYAPMPEDFDAAPPPPPPPPPPNIGVCGGIGRRIHVSGCV
ncbi:hypothetical protein [Mycobacterium sp. OTB74]|jgi:hypothetical protein|uniref:hypothetical protein n=1 Tax=Mycobacterium sp. OTB74 TaxID=1853452 RepID=UPI002476EDBF|nr:hypothetical protein [Mycobacterium sp. OTB74]MDH6244183.1 hypothetical protein [Mycobacterium sp. OTB74]